MAMKQNAVSTNAIPPFPLVSKPPFVSKAPLVLKPSAMPKSTASTSTKPAKPAVLPGPSTKSTHVQVPKAYTIFDDSSSNEEDEEDEDAKKDPEDASDESGSHEDSSDLDRAADTEEETFAEEVAALAVDTDYQEEDSVTALVTVPVATPSKL
jgi:hypothetical protein